MASSGPGYLDPDLIYALFYNRRSQDILMYLDSIPGSSDDPSCRTIRAMGELLLPNPVRGFVPVRDGPAWYHQNAMVAQSLAQTSRFCAPEMVDNPTNISPNPGHFMDPFNSSSYSGRMLTSHVPGSNELRHAAMANQGSDSSSSISAATFNPLQANSNNVIKFPILDERPNQASAFNLGTHASAFVPWRANSTDGHYMNPYNSSSCSGRMLTSLVPGTRSNVVNDPLGHATMLNQASAPTSGIPPATFFPLQANSNDVTNYNLRHAAMLNQVSASNTGIPAAMVLPLQENSNHVPALAVGVLSLRQPRSERFAPQELIQNTVSPQELEQSNRGTPAVGILSLRQPGSEQFGPRQLMQNGEVMPTADSKGMSDASEIIQQEEKSVRLSVASLIASDGTKGFAGVLIRGSKGQFITASCFPIPSMEPAMVFAAACCEAIKIAQLCRPTAAVVLESHLFPLLKNVLQQPVVLALKAILRKVLHRLAEISEESNGAARQLAMRALQMGVPELFLEIPDWLILN